MKMELRVTVNWIIHLNVDNKAELLCVILCCVCDSWAEGGSKLLTICGQMSLILSALFLGLALFSYVK